VEVDQDSTKKSNVLSELDPFSRRRTVISNPFEVSILNQYKEIKKDEMLETKEVVVKEVNPEETLKKVHDFDIEINMNLEETTKNHQKKNQIIIIINQIIIIIKQLLNQMVNKQMDNNKLEAQKC